MFSLSRRVDWLQIVLYLPKTADPITANAVQGLLDGTLGTMSSCDPMPVQGFGAGNQGSLRRSYHLAVGVSTVGAAHVKYSRGLDDRWEQ